MSNDREFEQLYEEQFTNLGFAQLDEPHYDFLDLNELDDLVSQDSLNAPPVIVSPPAVDPFPVPMTMETGSAGFLQPFQGAQFQQRQSSEQYLSDLSSVEGSPYLSAYAGSEYGDEGNIPQSFIDDGVPAGAPPPQIELLSSQLNGLLPQGLSPVTISIEAPEHELAERTPSLFSSNNSTRNNSPAHSRQGSMHSTTMKAGHFANMLSPSSANELLTPHEEMRAARQRRQSNTSNSNNSNNSNNSRSRSLSRSASRSASRERSLSANREKMLELASPTQGDRRAQKNPSIYACHLCEKRFTRPYNLKSHLRTHTDERPFVCAVCSRAFARQHDRNRHEELHSGKKKYECHGVLRDGGTVWGCGKKFARTDALGRHFKTEAGKECIRPLVEEHEREMEAGGVVRDELFDQFPGLLG